MMVSAVGGLGSDEPGHEEFIYPREDSEEVSRKGGRGVQGHGHEAPLLGGAGVGLVGASIDGVTAWDAFVLGEELGGVLGPVLYELLGGVDPVAELGTFDPARHDVGEEVDDECAVAGLLADDVGDSGRLALRCCFGCVC